MQLVLPPLRRTSEDAAKFAAAIHQEITQDAASLMAHLARVAAMVERISDGCPFWKGDHRDDAIEVAWLHHVITDGEIDTRTLRREGFSRIVVDDVEALSAADGPCHENWLRALAEDADLTTILVKMADIRDERSESQLSSISCDDVVGFKINYEQIESELIEVARSKGWEGDLDLLLRTN